jgi:hypothetical protein
MKLRPKTTPPIWAMSCRDTLILIKSSVFFEIRSAQPGRHRHWEVPGGRVFAIDDPMRTRSQFPPVSAHGHGEREFTPALGNPKGRCPALPRPAPFQPLAGGHGPTELLAKQLLDQEEC